LGNLFWPSSVPTIFINSAAFSAVTFLDMSLAPKLNAHFKKSSWRAEYLVRLDHLCVRAYPNCNVGNTGLSSLQSLCWILFWKTSISIGFVFRL
jgi:hypothetical protein